MVYPSIMATVQNCAGRNEKLLRLSEKNSGYCNLYSNVSPTVYINT